VKLVSFYPAPNVAGAQPNVSNFRANDPTLGICRFRRL
jgi:hypothetical protein